MVSCLEAVNHPTLLLTSISHVLKVFEHLHMLWMGMWVHPYTLTPVHVGPNFGNMGVRVSSNPHHAGAMFGGCKPSHFVYQIHIKCLWSVWATSYAVDEHMGAPLHSYTCAGGGKTLKKIGLLRVSPNNIIMSCLESVNHPTLLLTSILHVLKVFEHLHMLWMGMWVHPYTLTPVQVGPNFGNVGERVSPNPHHSWCHIWRL